MSGRERIDHLAAACARRLPAGAVSFEEARHAWARDLDALVAAVRDSGAGFAFDAEGRPAAIAAVRGALPSAEAELLDAVVEDVGAELAAWQEALYRVVLAARERPAGAGAGD